MVREVGGSYSWVMTICQERGEFLEAPNGPWDEMLLNGLRQESLRRFSKKEGFGNALRAGREQRPDCRRQEAEEEPGGMFRGMGEGGVRRNNSPKFMVRAERERG